jgi:hypothetical protein
MILEAVGSEVIQRRSPAERGSFLRGTRPIYQLKCAAIKQLNDSIGLGSH